MQELNGPSFVQSERKVRPSDVSVLERIRMYGAFKSRQHARESGRLRNETGRAQRGVCCASWAIRKMHACAHMRTRMRRARVRAPTSTIQG
eukprot:6179242-Pleurochrysis_carterae.AAC.1